MLHNLRDLTCDMHFSDTHETREQQSPPVLPDCLVTLNITYLKIANCIAVLSGHPLYYLPQDCQQFCWIVWITWIAGSSQMSCTVSLHCQRRTWVDSKLFKFRNTQIGHGRPLGSTIHFKCSNIPTWSSSFDFRYSNIQSHSISKAQLGQKIT